MIDKILSCLSLLLLLRCVVVLPYLLTFTLDVGHEQTEAVAEGSRWLRWGAE
jgi:hypothetical protein